MRIARTILLIGLAALAAAGCRPSKPAPPDELLAAKADGAESAPANDGFGLVVGGQYGSRYPVGVICFTPWGQAPSVRDVITSSDVITAGLSRRLEQARAHNLAMVERADYPFRDLCRPRAPDDDDTLATHNSLTNRPARPVSGPVRSLHEAARRGTAQELRHFMTGTPIDTVDGMGMTALAWAVARDNEPAIEALSAAGADPLAAGRFGEAPLYWAAVHGRRDIFRRLLARVPADRAPPKVGWSRAYLMAAAQGGDLRIVRQMLGDPHESIQVAHLGAELPPEILTLFLDDQAGTFADDLLEDALGWSSDGVRLDAVRLALGRGADPNGAKRGETPLGKVANGIAPRSPEAVRLLLAAGADPNALTRGSRPVWLAIDQGLRDNRTSGEADARAVRILDLLIAAGADVNLPDDDGRPLVWRLFFPLRDRPDQLDASYVTRETLAALRRRGVDFNTRWQGRTLLAAVEAKGEAGAEYAVWLRAVGGRR